MIYADEVPMVEFQRVIVECDRLAGELARLQEQARRVTAERDEALAECTELATHRDAALALLRRVFDDLGDWAVSRHPADHWYDGDPRPTRLPSEGGA